MQAKIIKLVLVFGVFLAALLFYVMEKQTRESTDPVVQPAAESDVIDETRLEFHPEPAGSLPKDELLVTENELPSLPAIVQDWLAAPAWNQPYIQRNEAVGSLDQNGGGTELSPALTIEISDGAEPIMDGIAYEADPAGPVTDRYCDLSLIASLGHSGDSRQRIVSVVWAFRDGTLLYQPAQIEARELTAIHRYALTGDHADIYVIRAMAVLDDGTKLFADSLPVHVNPALESD